MAWRRPQSLRARLLWLVLLTLAPAIALHFAAAVGKHRMAREAVAQGMQGLADLAAGNAQTLLANAGGILTGLTRLPELQSLDPAGAARVFAQTKDIFPNIARILLVRPDGSMVVASDQPEVQASYGDRPWLQLALEKSGLILGGYQVGKRTGKPGMVLASPVANTSGETVGVCVLTLRLDWFADIFNTIRLPEATEISLFDDQGLVLAVWPPAPERIGQPLADAVKSPPWSGPGPDDRTRHAVFATVHPPFAGQLHIRLTQPATAHAAILATTWQRDMLFSGLSVALALAAAHFFSRAFIMRPAKQLAAMAKAMAAGDLDRRSGLADGQGEMADLGRALDAMADRLRQRIRFTQELIDAIPAPLFYKGLDGCYLGCNTAYERNIRPLDAVVGRTVREIEPPAGAELCMAMDEIAINSPSHTVEYETVLEYLDATVRNLVVFKSLFRDMAGAPAGIVGVILDITGRKRSETALLASKRRHQALLDSMRDGFAVMSGDYRLVESNPAFREMLGYSQEELSGLTYHDLTPARWHEAEATILGEVEVSGFSDVFEKEYRRKDGSVFPVALRLHRHPAEDGDDRRYFAIVRDITDVKAIESDLRQAKVTAEAANRAKSDFLAKMSHEIRTPLHAVIGMTELTLGTDLSLEQRDALETAREAAGNLLDIINDILDISRIEARGLELACEDFDLRRTLAGVVRTLRPQATRKGLPLLLAIAAAVPRQARGDQGRLRQILLNLVGNAVKFTDHGSVAVTAGWTAPDQLELTVTDTGVGIPPDRLERVFDMFTQADSSVVRHFGGTGLGLAICRELVRLMGGTIEAKSILGSGSVFQVRLPLAQALAVPPPPPAAPRIPAPPATPGAAAVLRVLLAEDNPVNVKVATTYLARRGHVATVAPNGQRALDVLAREAFDVVLMDLEMPELDGIEATRRLRAGQAGVQNRDIPVVAMTAHALSGSMERCLAAGMTDFLPKPLDFSALDGLLAHIAAGAGGILSVSPPPADAAGAVLDTPTALRRLGDDDALLLEIENDFLRQYPRKLRLITLCSDRENWEEAALAAHSLKNIAGAVGAESSRRLAGRLEASLRAVDAVAAKEALAALTEALAAAGAAIKASRHAPDPEAG
ncbi:ATP-binding protein [Solidesulfovibrio sp.]